MALNVEVPPGRQDIEHSLPAYHLSVVSQTGNYQVFRVGKIGIVLQNLLESLLALLTQVSGELQHSVQVLSSRLAVGIILDQKPRWEVQIQKKTKNPLQPQQDLFGKTLIRVVFGGTMAIDRTLR